MVRSSRQGRSSRSRARSGRDNDDGVVSPIGKEEECNYDRFGRLYGEEKKDKGIAAEENQPQRRAGANRRGSNMDSISKKLATLDSRRQDLAKQLDGAQKVADYESFQRLGNNYLGTILESIDLYIDLIKEISSEPVAGELKNEFSEIVKKGKNTKEIEGQSEWISNDVSPLYEKVRQICACVYSAVAKIDQEAGRSE